MESPLKKTRTIAWILEAFASSKLQLLTLLSLNVWISTVEISMFYATTQLILFLGSETIGSNPDLNAHVDTYFDTSLKTCQEWLNIENGSLLHMIFCIMVSLQIILSIGRYLQARLMSSIRIQWVMNWTRELAEHFYKAHWTSSRKHPPQKLAQLCHTEIEGCGDMAFLLLRSFHALCIGTFYTLFLYQQQQEQLLWMLLLLSVITFILRWLLPKPRETGQQLTQEGEAQEREMFHFFSNYKALQSSPQNPVSELLKSKLTLEHAWKNAHLIIVYGRSLQNIIFSVGFAGACLLIWEMRELSLSTLLTCSYLYYRLQPLLSQAITDLQMWKQSQPSLEKVISTTEDLKHHAMVWGHQLAPKSPIVLDIHHPQFQQNDKGKTSPTISISEHLHLREGELLLITGKNGSGKTTLADGIAGIFPYTSGHIHINGHPREQYQSSQWKKMLSYCPQEPMSFRGDLIQNLNWGKGHDKEHSQQHDHAPLKHWMHDFSNPDQTQLTESGVGCSGGELKKIDLMRAFQSLKPIQILDEPTEHLDTQKRQELLEAVQANREGRIWIIVSHDPIWSSIPHTHLKMKP